MPGSKRKGLPVAATARESLKGGRLKRGDPPDDGRQMLPDPFVLWA